MMSSLYIGATGLKTQADGLGAVSNNLANVNTVAYKQTSLQFSDLLSGYLPTGSISTGVSQTGSGAAVATSRTLFTHGTLQTTTLETDMAIAGIGFFGVRDAYGVTNYTRAGNFSLTEEGALVDSSGWTLLGRLYTNGVESSATTPLEMNLSGSGLGSMAASASTLVTACADLGGIEDQNASETNSFFALAQSWNGTSSPPLAQGSYSYSQPFEYYDSEGSIRTGTIYYDSAGGTAGMNAVEYVVAMDPSEDASALAGTSAAGLLMAGTLTFNSSGELVNITAFTPPLSGDPTDLTGWNAASMENGFPVMSVSPSGTEPQTVGLNMGLRFSGAAAGTAASASQLAVETVYVANDEATTQNNTSRMYGDTPSSLVTQSNGYAYGELKTLSISADGVITGSYSNDQMQDLCRITLYRFTSQDGLQNEGGNHYSATLASGAAQEGTAGDENFGTVTQYALEQSNVDYASEFSNLIVTQRAFQMNSKVITTSDTMLQRALEIKRQ